jgi:hypothetical protein
MHPKGSANGSPDLKKNDSEDDFEDVILFVEYKYCTVCHIEQVNILFLLILIATKV